MRNSSSLDWLRFMHIPNDYRVSPSNRNILPFFVFRRKTKTPDFVWKSGTFFVSPSFKVVPPGIVIYFQVAEYHSFTKATQL